MLHTSQHGAHVPCSVVHTNPAAWCTRPCSMIYTSLQCGAHVPACPAGSHRASVPHLTLAHFHSIKCFSSLINCLCFYHYPCVPSPFPCSENLEIPVRVTCRPHPSLYTSSSPTLTWPRINHSSGPKTQFFSLYMQRQMQPERDNGII